MNAYSPGIEKHMYFKFSKDKLFAVNIALWLCAHTVQK